MPLIELGLIDGDYFASNHVNAIEAAINTAANAGDVKMTVATVAPIGWLLLSGQVVPEAESLYPALWAVAPTDWKSGASLTLPNSAQRFPLGGTPGTVGGSNTKTISAANLPPHAHSIDHDHPSLTFSGITSNAVDHYYGGNGNHNHPAMAGFPGDVKLVATGGPTSGSPAGINATGSGYIVLPDHSTGSSGALHQHDYSGTIDVPNLAGTSGNGPGTSTALDITPAYFTVNFMIAAW